jgi:hypothetical protein
VPSRTKALIETARKLRAQAQRLRAEAKWLHTIHERRFPDPQQPRHSIEEAKAMSAQARQTALELAEQEKAEALAALRRRNGLPE